jgi:XTP/dITP diphosphohydrolase
VSERQKEGEKAKAKVVVATRNRGKLKEILRLVDADRLGLELVAIDEVLPDLELVEDEATFEGNALAKARQAAQATGLPALADDSGLEVDVLAGAPGVRSARYAGEPSDDRRNNAKLVEALRAVVPMPPSFSARFRCAAALVDPGRGAEVVRVGACEGEVIIEPRGDQGFGYDPHFWLPAMGRTMAELSIEQKNVLSHRAAAFGALAEALQPRPEPAPAERPEVPPGLARP